MIRCLSSRFGNAIFVSDCGVILRCKIGGPHPDTRLRIYLRPNEGKSDVFHNKQSPDAKLATEMQVKNA
jgi:hypothetical protein